MSLVILPKSRNRVSQQQGVTGAGLVVSGGASAVFNKKAQLVKAPQLSVLQRRARALSYSKALCDQLAKVTKSAGMKRSYERTRDLCGSIIEQVPGEGLRSYHCKQRFCLSCSRMRTAQMITAYFPIIGGWIESGEGYMVTLTLRNVSFTMLRPTLQQMHKSYSLCIRALQRKLPITIQAMRSTECTANLDGPVPTAHPHLHILIKTKEAAEMLVEEWLYRHPNTAVRVAQNVTKAHGVGSAKELLKYATKTLDGKVGPDGARLIVPPTVLDEIFCAMKGLRLFQTSHIEPAVEVPSEEESEEGEIVFDKVTQITKNKTEYIRWVWVQSLHDWANMGTGELLAEYMPSRHTLSVLGQLERWKP